MTMISFERIISKSGRRTAGRCLAALTIGFVMAPFAALAQDSEQGTVSSEQGSGQESGVANQESGGSEPASGQEMPTAESGITNQESGQTPEEPATSGQNSEQEAVSSEQAGGQTSDSNAGGQDAVNTPPEIPIATSTSGANQDTANPQTTIGGSDLITTVDPNAGTSTEGSILGVSTSTPAEQAPGNQHPATGEPSAVTGDSALSPPSNVPASPSPLSPPDNTPLPPSSDQTLPPHPDVIATLSREALKPKPEYTLGVVGTVIAAKAKPRWQAEVAGEPKAASPTIVTAEPTLTPDSENGTLSVSGACRLESFSIILYRHPDDYDRDPASYIVNKAFPCENGSYSYTLADLPKNLAPGTYYLLVAEQGDSGPWHPISGVVPVTIAPHP